MRKRHSREVREEILVKIRSGQKVKEVARQHGVHESTIRGWLERDTGEGSSAILEMSRLRRENESLMRLVGQLTYEAEMQKKNQRRVRH